MTKKIKKQVINKAAGNEMVVADETLLADSQEFENNFQKEDLALPFLKVLQSKSPACDEDDGAYIEGAKAGMFLLTGTDELYKESVEVIPCLYQRVYLKWQPYDEGGGFLGEVPESEAVKLDQDKRGRYITDDGNEVMDTRLYYVLVKSNSGNWKPALLSLSSTQIKKAKNWNSVIKDYLVTVNDRTVNPPSFARSYILSAVSESKEKFNWKGIKITVGSPTYTDKELYSRAKEFAKQVSKGQVKVDLSTATDEKAESSYNDDYDDIDM